MFIIYNFETVPFTTSGHSMKLGKISFFKFQRYVSVIQGKPSTVYMLQILPFSEVK